VTAFQVEDTEDVYEDNVFWGPMDVLGKRTFTINNLPEIQAAFEQQRDN
jgi:hypothetical protein